MLPEKLKGGAAKAAVTKLLGLGFLNEVRAKPREPAWRTDDDGLKITKAGSAAIGLEDKAKGDEETALQAKSRRKPNKWAPGEVHRPRAPRRVETGTDHRAHAAQQRRNARRLGRSDRLAAAHHAGGSHQASQEGLHDREGEEPEGQNRLSHPHRRAGRAC